MRIATFSILDVNFAFVLYPISGTETLHQFVNLGSAETGKRDLDLKTSNSNLKILANGHLK